MKQMSSRKVKQNSKLDIFNKAYNPQFDMFYVTV